MKKIKLKQLAKQGYDITDSKPIEIEEICKYIQANLETAPKGSIYFNNRTKILSSYGKTRDSQSHLIVPDLMISGSGGFNPRQEIFFYSPQIRETGGRASVRLPLHTKEVVIMGHGSFVDIYAFNQDEEVNPYTIKNISFQSGPREWIEFLNERMEKKGLKKYFEQESIQILSYANPIFLPNAESRDQDLIE
jgi:hypothetical protein